MILKLTGAKRYNLAPYDFVFEAGTMVDVPDENLCNYLLTVTTKPKSRDSDPKPMFKECTPSANDKVITMKPKLERALTPEEFVKTVVAEKQDAPVDELAELTIPELKVRLDDAEVTYNPNMNKSKLVTLLRDALKADEETL